MVSVASVEVLPDAVSAVQGDRVQLVARIYDDRDEPLSTAAVEWNSNRPSIASVDAQGIVEAHAVGSAVVRATFQGVSGATEVLVLRGPSIQAAKSSVPMYAAPGSSPDPESVTITNGGARSLDGLTAAVTYADGQPADWLQVELSGTTAPAQLMLTPRSDQLGSGMYEADVRVTSTSSAADAVITVALSVAGFQVSEDGGDTAVREGGLSEHLSVVLSARPSTPVVLSVSSSDPGEVSVSPPSLRFTPANWSSPQSVTVRAVDDVEDDGDQNVTVIVSVDVAQSPDAFERLGDQTVIVTTVDNDERDERPGSRIVIAETNGETVVSEDGTYDSIRVTLSAPPASNVVISVTSQTPAEVQVTSRSTLIFSPFDWNVPQIVVVRAIDDSFRDNVLEVSVTLSVVSSLSDGAYDGQSARVIVREIDNEGGSGDDDDEGGGRGGGPGG